MFTHPDHLRPRQREEARELGAILMDRFERAADALNRMGEDFAAEFFLQADDEWDKDLGYPDPQLEIRELKRRVHSLERILS